MNLYGQQSERNKKLKTLEVRTIQKETDYGTGVKALYCQRMLCELTRNMASRGCSPEQIAIFQSDFIEANDFVVPDSFFTECDWIDNYFNERTVSSEKNTPVSVLYKDFVDYCHQNKFPSCGKGKFMAWLRSKAMLSPRATVDGKSCNNVVKKIEIILEGVRE